MVIMIPLQACVPLLFQPLLITSPTVAADHNLTHIMHVIQWLYNTVCFYYYTLYELCLILNDLVCPFDAIFEAPFLLL